MSCHRVLSCIVLETQAPAQSGTNWRLSKAQTLSNAVTRFGRLRSEVDSNATVQFGSRCNQCTTRSTSSGILTELMPLRIKTNVQCVVSIYFRRLRTVLRGCASVLKTYFSNGMTSSSVNKRYKYFNVSAKKKESWLSLCAGGLDRISWMPL